MSGSRSSTGSWGCTIRTSADRRPGLALWACGAALALAFAAAAQPAPPKPSGDPKAAAVDPATLQNLTPARAYRPPAGIAFRASDFTSENVRLKAEWFYPAQDQGRRLPTVIMAPGWGATAASLREDAVDLARAGYLVMVFDYRGWGASDGRVVRTPFGAQVQELRGYIDPEEQAEDWFNAISYAVTEPMTDAGRIGLMGADLAGGHVLHVAARDARVKALVSQVSRVDLRPVKPYQPDPARTIAEANAEAARLTDFPPPDPAGPPGAVGNKVVRWAPVEDAGRVGAAALFVLAEKEELFSNTNNGQMACEAVTGPRKLVMLPKITHYGVFGAERPRAIAAAIGWFDAHLKTAGAPAAAGTKPERGECFPPPEPPKGEEDPNGSGEARKVQDASGRWN